MQFLADFQEKRAFYANNSYTAAILCIKRDILPVPPAYPCVFGAKFDLGGLGIHWNG